MARTRKRNPGERLLNRCRRLLRDCLDERSPGVDGTVHLVLTGDEDSWRLDAHLDGEMDLDVHSLLLGADDDVVSAISIGTRPILTVGGVYFGQPLVWVIHLHPGGISLNPSLN